ncbi:MAG: hypothetical protein JXC32_16120, partial [Anaerolineae bacterium]|nr:hypothetical protein [Anaerolineae bacterium]
QLRRSAELARTTRPRGLYLPIWTFDLMGEIGWRGYESASNADANGLALSLATGRIRINDGSSGQLVSGRRVYEGTHYVMLDDVVVPATHTLPYAVSEVFRSFDLELAVLYDPVFLSDWPAELYEVAVSDASLVARRRALNSAYESVRIQAARSAGGSLQNLQAFSRSLAVQAYKLVLVPVWLANYRHDTETYTVAVNGQNGRAFGQSPNRGLGGMIRDWLST